MPGQQERPVPGGGGCAPRKHSPAVARGGIFTAASILDMVWVSAWETTLEKPHFPAPLSLPPQTQPELPRDPADPRGCDRGAGAPRASPGAGRAQRGRAGARSSRGLAAASPCREWRRPVAPQLAGARAASALAAEGFTSRPPHLGLPLCRGPCGVPWPFHGVTSLVRVGQAAGSRSPLSNRRSTPLGWGASPLSGPGPPSSCVA